LSVQVSGGSGSRVRVTQQHWGTKIELCTRERRNALDRQAVVELREAFAANGSGAVLLSAEGPAFCAGGDLRMLGDSAKHGDLAHMMLTNAAAFADVIEAIVASPRPVVAAIDGPAVGGGASLALACDVRIATPRARLVFAWGRHGLPPDGCITATLAAAVGPARAQSLLADGADIGVDSDVAPLLFTRIVDVDRFEDEALAAVIALADSPRAPATKAATRELLLPVIRRQREEELAAIARATADTAIGERLAMLYKIDR
jgi:enoyl-CoA hydratase/carnithine racemase